MKNATCLSGNIPSQTKLKRKQVWVEKGFMGNPDRACAVCRFYLAAHKRQSLLTTGQPMDNPAYLPIYTGWRVYIKNCRDLFPSKQIKMNMHSSVVMP